MSDLVFPSLPGVDVAVTREPAYATQVHESVSGKEVRVSWRTAPRIHYRLRFNVLRAATAAPSPFAAYHEEDVILHFLDTHLGSFDSFLYLDPHTNANVRVRLVEDSLRFEQIVPGLWQVSELSLVSVL
jgi:hypothetical protein